MLAIVLSILIALSAGEKPCALGENINWTQWRDSYGESAEIVFTLKATASTPEVWLYEDSAGNYLLFVFQQPIDNVLASGESVDHGQCARLFSGGG